MGYISIFYIHLSKEMFCDQESPLNEAKGGDSGGISGTMETPEARAKRAEEAPCSPRGTRPPVSASLR